MNNVLEYLEHSASLYPDKICAKDEYNSCTYNELLNDSQHIGVLLSEKTSPGKPIAVLMDKGISCLKAFMGILYAGCFYTLIDPSFPTDRINNILSILKTDTVITDNKSSNSLSATKFAGETLNISQLGLTDNNYNDTDCTDILLSIRRQSTDLDPVYCNFTSGSTGVPKGVLVCHRSVIDFIDTFTQTFGINSSDIIGNQAPFDFDVSVKDIYSTLAVGATIVIIPKSFFMFPNAVMDMIDDNKVTTLIWAVSALTLLNRLHSLKYKVPKSINKILFSGEVMPVKHLNAWRSCYPDAVFVNLYGPTEITCNCTYYICNKDFMEGEKLPIGQAFPNERVFLLNDENEEITSSETDTPGEICVSGTCLALGYYNNPELTMAAFTPNPLNTHYTETIYRTGDLAYYGDDGLLYFAGRKDFQIKHMGHRIELEEIEHVLNGVSKVDLACCFFDEKKSKIVAFYSGNDDKKAIFDEMKTQVPEYMVPNILRHLSNLPLNKNGKLDRNRIRQIYEDGKTMNDYQNNILCQSHSYNI